jgi:Dna[CI] antecedent, DciA
MAARKIEFFIESSSDLRGIKAQIDRLRTFQQVYDSIVPDGFGQCSRISRLETRTLIISADNGVVAAKLRQFSPKLLDQFRKQGLEITLICIEVQVGKSGQKPPYIEAYQKRLSSKTLGTLLKFNNKIESGALKDALSEMINRHVCDLAHDKSEEDGGRTDNESDD